MIRSRFELGHDAKVGADEGGSYFRTKLFARAVTAVFRVAAEIAADTTRIRRSNASYADIGIRRIGTADSRRVGRDLSRYAKDRSDRAREELCAEIGSALVCANLGIVPELEPRPDHAAYVASWIKILSNETRAIFSAAAHAQRAVAYLHSLQPQAESEQEAA